MFFRKIFITTTFLLFIPVLASAQMRNHKVDIAQSLRPGKVNGIISLLGLDPQKFSMSHSFSLSFASSGGQNYNSALYLNTMLYRLSNPLTLSLQIGIQHHPFGNKQGNTTLQNQMFISRAGLQYQPSENFKLYLEYSQSPASTYYNTNPFRNSFSQNRAWFEPNDGNQQK